MIVVMADILTIALTFDDFFDDLVFWCCCFVNELNSFTGGTSSS